MDYRTEPYVRLYTRDTSTWIHMSWQARVTLPLLLRKLERHGAYDLGRWGFQGLAEVLRVPHEIIERGVTDLVTEGVVILNGTVLLVPNFLDAQTALRPKTGAERVREHRERKKNEEIQKAHAPLPGLDPPQSVTTVTPQRYEAPSAVPVPLLNSTGGESERGAQPDTTDGAKTPPRSPQPRSKKASQKRSVALTREELLPLIAEDLPLLRLELDVDPLEAVDSFLSKRRMGDTRAAFREWTRNRVKMGLLKPNTNGAHHTMSPPKKREPQEKPLSIEESREAVRKATEALERIGET